MYLILVEISAERVHSRGMALLGGGWFSPFGTFTEYVVVERDQVIKSPSHLDDVHMAAWPLAGVTAWRRVRLLVVLKFDPQSYNFSRATMVNARIEAGHNILITGTSPISISHANKTYQNPSSSGIGGGVAITALQLCVAKGANVYVTSGDEEKIAKAVKLGAKGGVNYKDRKQWTLLDMLQTIAC